MCAKLLNGFEKLSEEEKKGIFFDLKNLTKKNIHI